MSDSKRVNFEMDANSHERLIRLKQATEASSYAQVTANSYRLYELLLQMEREGKKLLIKDGEETETLRLIF